MFLLCGAKLNHLCRMMGPRWAKIWPRCSKMPPRCTQGATKIAQDASKIPPRCPQDVPRTKKNDPQLLRKNARRMTLNCLANAYKDAAKIIPNAIATQDSQWKHRSERSERRAQRHRSKQQVDLEMLPNIRHIWKQKPLFSVFSLSRWRKAAFSWLELH